MQKEKAVYLIDAGYNHDKHWKYLIDALKENGLAINDITAILLTHHHIDHIGLVHRLMEKRDIPVFIHPYALPSIKRDPAFIYRRYLYFNDLFKKMDTGEFGRDLLDDSYKKQINKKETALDWNLHIIDSDKIFDFEVIPIPGHAPDQVAFYLREENIIFLGDVLIGHLRSNAFIEPSLDFTRPLALKQHIQSLKKIIELNPTTALSGHGKVIKEPAELAGRRLEAIEDKATKIRDLIGRGISTGSELMKTRHKDKYDKILPTLLSDLLSYLDYLEYKGDIYKEEINGSWHWRVQENPFN